MFHKNLFISLGFLSATFTFADIYPAHQPNSLPYTVIGGYGINEARIQELNNKRLTVNRYGTTSLLQAKGPDDADDPKALLDPLTNEPIIYRDQHYPLYKFDKPLTTWVDKKSDRDTYGFGIRVIPAVPGFTGRGDVHNLNTAANKDGNKKQIRGSELVDNYLRRIIYGTDLNGKNAKPGDLPIFVQIAYMHPEGFEGEPFDIAGEPGLKTEMGFTHKGIYLGQGKTVNSPPGYHDNTWWGAGDTNYPALLTVMDFKGLVDASGHFNYKALAINGTMTAIILNETHINVDIFPRQTSYKFDYLYSNTLERTLDFYARWLEHDPIFEIQDEDTQNPRYDEAQQYKSYCAEHATEIANVLLNLPQSVEGYKEVFGAAGEGLFEKAMDEVYRSDLRSGDDAKWVRNAYLGAEQVFRDQDQTKSIKPLWKLLGNEGPVVLKDAASGKYLASNPKFKIPGYSLAWKPETVADLLKDFVREYLPWQQVSSLTTIPAILGFSNEAILRMNMTLGDYIKNTTPIIEQILLHEAAMHVGLEMIAGQTNEEVLFANFQKARDATINGTKLADGTFKPGLNLIMQGMAKKMQSAIYANGKERPAAIVIDQDMANKVLKVAAGFEVLIAGSGTSQEDAGWKNVYALAKSSVASAPVKTAVAYRSHLYDDVFTPAVQKMVSDLNNIDPVLEKDANGKLKQVVKYYYAPAVHVRVALGIHDWEGDARDNVRLWPIGHVVRAEETEPIPANNSQFIDDKLQVNLSIL